jgi:hypothetical protein
VCVCVCVCVFKYDDNFIICLLRLVCVISSISCGWPPVWQLNRKYEDFQWNDRRIFFTCVAFCFVCWVPVPVPVPVFQNNVVTGSSKSFFIFTNGCTIFFSLFHRAFQFTIYNGPTNALDCNKTLIQMSHT